MPLTPSQELAAATRGRPLLVAAAAGSGKTRVLVERLMRYVDDGADIDDFLVITYTRAAAAELRGRIQKELAARLAAAPADRRLRRQTELCCRAAIGTIDSVCGRLLREYVHLTGLAPDFRVAEEERAESLRRAVLERVLDARYETIERDGSFRALVDSVGEGRSDGRLAALTLSLFDSLRSHPHPDAWMARCRAALDVSGCADAGETPWGRWLLDDAALQADWWAARLESALGVLAGDGHERLRAAYGAGFAAAAEALRELSRACALSWERAAACFPLLMKIGAFRGEDGYKDTAKAVWDDCREAVKKLAARLGAPSAQLLAELGATRGAMEALLDLTRELGAAYAQEKRRQGLVDFSDQEHMVLELLEDAPNGVASELSARWREVMVDEYQDVNECQDRLFDALSGGGRRLFLVGDVKQSIYRFRLADPGIFLAKYDRFADVSAAPDSEAGGRIALRENFRSSESVIAGCNRVFENLLSRELGEIDYDEAAHLVRGRADPGDGERMELDILALPAAPDGEERPDRLALEADMVARRIRALLDARTPIPDGAGGTRALEPGDIAILLRSYKSGGGRFRAALAAQGVPAAAQRSGGFFRALEVTTLLSLLAVIDNPRQDIPLVAVLRSPLYGFTPDELAAIRARDRNADFYTALTLAREEPRCAAFLAELEEYRALAADLPTAELLGLVCARSDVDALLSAMPDAAARRENVQLLLDYARQFEQEGSRGLFAFVAWMRRLAERGEEPRAAVSERRDAVQILSVHRSKGLEYPVVFLCDTARRFNLSDAQGAVLVHPQLGLGAKVTDSARGAEYPSLSWRAVAARLRRESLSEELRVLYVAMTRARERLFITAAWQEPEAKLEKLAQGLASPVAPLLLAQDASCSVWLARCALLCPETLALRVVPCAEAAGAAAPETPEAPAAPESAPLRLAERLAWRYAWPGAQTLPSKLTASALRAGEPPDEDAPPPAAPPRPARLPEFGGGAAALSGAEKGTAVHLALQFIDYARAASRAGIEAELARLEREGWLTPAQARAADPAWLERFFRSELGERLLHAERVWREQRFTLLLPAAELDPACTDDDVLLQGVVDCCFEEDGALTVLDYKTDYVTPETLAARAAAYTPQLRAYARALERILRLPVREGVLYFLRLGRAVEVPLK